MSYDLYFFPAAQKDFAEAFRALFEGRPHYALGESQVMYRNPATGVYFSLELVVPGDAEDNGDEGDEDEGTEWVEDPRFGAPYIFFAIHLLRSQVFALEAAEELAAWSGAAGLGLFDPQSGLFADRFDPDVFLAGWREANDAERADAAARAETLLTLPATANEQTWRWNAGREALRQSLGPGLAVPLLQHLAGPNGAVRRVFVWALGSATIVPPGAEWALLIDDRAKPGLLARLTRKNQAPPVAGVVPIAALTLGMRPEGEHRRLDPPDAARAAELIRQAEPPGERLPADAVLDA